VIWTKLAIPFFSRNLRENAACTLGHSRSPVKVSITSARNAQSNSIRTSDRIRSANRAGLASSSGPQTEIDVTYRKQTTEKFLTGAKMHIRETRICAKISVETNEEMSEEMKATR
jgi:hypothetical protein